jgi:serine protease Do
VIRDGREKDVVVTLGTRPGEKELRESYRTGGTLYDLLGLKVEPYTADEEASFSFGSGDGVLVVDVKGNSSAAKNEIRRGDVITEVGKNEITSVNDYKAEVKSYSKGDTIMLRIVRNGSPLFIAFEIE